MKSQHLDQVFILDVKCFVRVRLKISIASTLTTVLRSRSALDSRFFKMGQHVSRTDFEWTDTDEPHAARRSEILSKSISVEQVFGFISHDTKSLFKNNLNEILETFAFVF